MIKSCYIHIPFCKNICSYCDFCKIYYNKKLINNYLNSLEKEINKYYQNDILDTIYVGGGTPSSLSINELNHLFSILKKLKLSKNYEFSFECNITDINKELLTILKNNRVNRLSIGIQSFNKKILDNIGRISLDKDKIKQNIALAKTFIPNINIDLIFSANNETLKDLKEDLSNFLLLKVPHISIYSLILEENTILSINNYQELNSDISRAMYDLIIKTLKENGYIHYEISNFSYAKYESKHNLNYWNNDRYYGFGLGSSGYVDNIRYTNTRSLTNYNNGSFRYIIDDINKDIDMSNEMILNLRKIQGINKENFKKKYNKEIKEVFNVSKLKENDKYYYIDESDLYISNSILIDFI